MTDKTCITFHVFHYVTHSVVWQVFYGPAQPDMQARGIETPSATDGMGIQSWCSFFLTRESAEKFVSAECPDSYFDVNTVWH